MCGAAYPGCGLAFQRVQPAESRPQARLPAPHGGMPQTVVCTGGQIWEGRQESPHEWGPGSLKAALPSASRGSSPTANKLLDHNTKAVRDAVVANPPPI